MDGFVDYDEEDSNFKGDSTLPDDIKSLETALDAFHLLLQKELIEQIVYQTNLYSTQVIWKPFWLWSCTCPSSNYQVQIYWNKRFRVSKVSEVMTVNLFEEIKRFLHLNNNTKYVQKGQPGHDKYIGTQYIDFVLFLHFTGFVYHLFYSFQCVLSFLCM